MKQEMEQYKEVMDAVNGAADGEWIAGSEEQVRDLSAEMRRRDNAAERSSSRVLPGKIVRRWW